MEILNFNRWLLHRMQARDLVRFHFAIPPRTELKIPQPALMADCFILQASGKFLLLEFQDGEKWWVARDIIISCATAEFVGENREVVEEALTAK